VLCFGPTAADYIEGALGLDGVTLGELTATRQAQFVTAVANATSSTVGDVTFLGAEQTIGEYLRVRFRIMSVDASVSLSPFACVWVCLWVCLRVWVGMRMCVRYFGLACSPAISSPGCIFVQKITALSAPDAFVGGSLTYIFSWQGFGTVRFVAASIVAPPTDSTQTESWLGGLTAILLFAAVVHRLGLNKLPGWEDGTPAHEKRSNELDNLEGVEMVNA